MAKKVSSYFSTRQIGHYAALFLSKTVKILKFCAADMCAKRGEKHRNEGFIHVF